MKILMNALCCGAVLLLLSAPLAFAADKGAAKHAAKPSAFLGDAEKGAEKYKIFCITCHGEKGDGNGPAGANLTPKPGNFTDPARYAELTDQYIYEMIQEGGLAKGRSALMVPWKTSLTEEEIRNVTAYVRAFGRPAAVGKPAAKKSAAAPKSK